MATYIAHEIIGGLYEKTVKMEVSRTTSRQFTLAMRECGLSDSVTRALKSALSGGDMAVLVCGKWILHSTGEVVA